MGEAEYLLRNELLQETFARIEADALERCVQAPPGDDETRRLAAMQVRAIRSVRQELEALLRERATPADNPVV